MLESSDTIRDLLTGFNTMQAQLGLTPSSGQSFQSPATPMPRIKHPSEVSQELMQRSTQQMQMSIQMAQQLRMTPGPGVLGLSPGGRGDVGQPPTPAGQAAGAYSQQFQERMQDIESRYMSPNQAQGYARSGGQQGFMNLPSPIYQTAPSMGIFRPNLTLPPSIPLAREAPMFPTPFTPNIPSPRFQGRTEMDYNQRALEDERMFAGTMAAAPTVANLAAGGGVAALGRGVGGRIGQAIGGARGRAVGQIGGLIGGGALGFGAIGGLAERGMESITEPIVQRRAQGRQLEQISQQFVVGGADLNQETGRGLSTKAAVGLAGQMQQNVEAGQTGGFNMRDMMKMTGLAAEGGMLDMAQNGQQIASQMRNVARGLQSFMQIAQEPDVRRAMQQMSAMRSMGLTIPETSVAAQNAQKFARMAGTTVQGLQQQAGMPGAMTFQQMGMTAGLGMQVGQAAAGLSRQAVAGGAFTPGQLAMAGGQSGLTQTLTETAGAGLGVDFPLLAMLKRGKGGQLAIDEGKAQQIMRGELSLSQQAQMGAQNVQDLGGERVIAELSTQLNQLRDQLGRTLGPQGSTMLALRQATNVMSEVPGLPLGAALIRLGMSPQKARSVEIMGNSPQFWQNVRDQHEVNIRQMRDDETSRREQQSDASSLSGRFGSWWRSRGVLDRPGEVFRDASQSISEWWTERSKAQEAADRGALYVPESRMMRVESKRAQKEIDRFVSSGDQARWEERQGKALDAQNRPITAGQREGAAWNIAASVGIGVATLATGGLAGIAIGAGGAAASQFATSGAPAESTYVQALRAGGGITGALAKALPSAAIALAGDEESQRAVVEEQRQKGQVGAAIRAGRGLSTRESLAVQKDLRSAAAETARGLGVTLDKNIDLIGLATTGALNVFRQKTGMFGHDAATPEDLRKGIIESMVAGGLSRKFAETYVKSEWKAGGLRDIVMRKVEPLLTDETRGSYVESQKAESIEDLITGANLKEVQEKLEDIEENVMEEQLGMSGGDWRFSATDVAQKKYKKMAMEQSPEMMLYLQAKALGGKEGAAMEKRLRTEMGADEFAALQEEALKLGKSDPLTEDDKLAFKFAAEKSAKRSGEEMLDVAKKQRTGFIGRRGREQGARGAATFATISAFQSVVQSGSKGVEATLEKLGEDTDQLRDLEKENPALARIAKQYKESSDEAERKELRSEFYKGLQQLGKKSKKREFGGTGIGSEEEERERKQMGIEADIEDAIKKGKPGEAFAKSIPHFAKATSELQDATKDLKDTVQAARLMLKAPGTG